MSTTLIETSSSTNTNNTPTPPSPPSRFSSIHSSLSSFYSSPSSPSPSPIIPSGHLETSDKFWQFKVEDGLVTYIRYGNIDYDGSLKERAIQIQEHSCYFDAINLVNSLIDEKIKAGYVGWTHY